MNMAIPAETAFLGETVYFLSSARTCIHIFIQHLCLENILTVFKKITSSLPALRVIVQIATEQLHQEFSQTMVTALSGRVIVT